MMTWTSTAVVNRSLPRSLHNAHKAATHEEEEEEKDDDDF